jgi:hypothetical protein
VRFRRRLERLLLGSLMSLIAFLAERRVLRALGRRR